MTQEKRPRHYAEEILSLKTKEARRKALAEVPEHIREIVRIHVEHAFMTRKNEI